MIKCEWCGGILSKEMLNEMGKESIREFNGKLEYFCYHCNEWTRL